jgi:hypothetical protein
LKEPYEAVEMSSDAVKERSKPSDKDEKIKLNKNPPKIMQSEDSKSSTKVSVNKNPVVKKMDSGKSAKNDLSTRKNKSQHPTMKISDVHHDDLLIPGPSNVAVPKAPTKNELEIFAQIKPQVFIPVPPQTKVSVSKPPAKNELENLAPSKPGSLSPLLDIHTVNRIIFLCGLWISKSLL